MEPKRAQVHLKTLLLEVMVGGLLVFLNFSPLEGFVRDESYGTFPNLRKVELRGWPLVSSYTSNRGRDSNLGIMAILINLVVAGALIYLVRDYSEYKIKRDALQRFNSIERLKWKSFLKYFFFPILLFGLVEIASLVLTKVTSKEYRSVAALNVPLNELLPWEEIGGVRNISFRPETCIWSGELVFAPSGSEQAAMRELKADLLRGRLRLVESANQQKVSVFVGF